MSKQEILNQYGIKMLNKAIRASLHGGQANSKIFSGGNQMDSFFDISYNDPNNINDEILTKVNYVLNGNTPPLSDIDSELSGLDTFAEVFPTEVRFYDFNTGDILQQVPLEHFKIIAEAWRDFLLQSPFNGAKI